MLLEMTQIPHRTKWLWNPNFEIENDEYLETKDGRMKWVIWRWTYLIEFVRERRKKCYHVWERGRERKKPHLKFEKTIGKWMVLRTACSDSIWDWKRSAGQVQKRCLAFCLYVWWETHNNNIWLKLLSLSIWAFCFPLQHLNQALLLVVKFQCYKW